MNQKVKDMLLDLGVFKRIDVPVEQVDQVRPEELRKDQNGHQYVIHDEGLSIEEIKIMLSAQQAADIRTIKSIVVFCFACSLLAAVLAFLTILR